MQHQVRSKPLIGFLGFFTSVLAVLAGFGLACYLGVRFTMMMNNVVGREADDGCQDHDNHNYQQKFCRISEIMLTINGNQEDML